MSKYRLGSAAILICAALLAYFVVTTEQNPSSKYHTKYGLDLSGGTHLVYEADVSGLVEHDVPDAMESLKNVIEKRVNVFGVSEPVVQVESGGIGSDGAERLIVELPGVTDIDEAVETIGKTPLLEFKLLDPNATTTATSSAFLDTGLTGRLLSRSTLGFGQSTGGQALANQPIVQLEFNDEGSELFAEITRENVGGVLAIFLDGEVLSLPTIQQEIIGGQAQITGDFTPEEARTLVRDLNLGALPVPIELVSTQTIGASLGDQARDAGVRAGVIGFGVIFVFLILWYRLPGVIAGVALSVYMLLMLSLFKVIPVVLTSAGVAGFILSIGMAVDANILVFERMKEELERGGASMQDAIKTGFSRAWTSIRDGNVSTLISAAILYGAGTTLTKGFAVTLALGVLLSMISALLITRTFLLGVAPEKHEGVWKFLYGHGIKK